jgi:hypothetical protein
MLSTENKKPVRRQRKPAAGDELVGLGRSENRPAVGTDGVESDESQIEQTDEADDYIQAQRQRRVNADLNRHFQIVAVDGAQQRHQQDQH